MQYFSQPLKAAVAGMIVPFFIYAMSNYVTYIHVQSEIDQLSFSSTQQWSLDVLQELAEDQLLVEPLVRLEPPAKNTAVETVRELTDLHALVSERSKEKEKEIISEIFLEGQKYGELYFSSLVDVSSKPISYTMFARTNADIRKHAISAKKEFDRVRPSYLDTSLQTTIPVPQHPAYPSGHATESYLNALLLSELDPKNREMYIESAKRIARNREIAGVHYASDSRAGQELAQLYFVQLQETAWYKRIIVQARKEWN